MSKSKNKAKSLFVLNVDTEEEFAEFFGALSVAINVLDGTAGGIGPQEKYKAKVTLMHLRGRLAARSQQPGATS